MPSRSILVKVPATVGNFGGAEGCAALALDASLNVKVTPRLDGHVGIRYFGENGERVPRDRSNLVVRALEAALHLKEFEFTGADFEIYSSVPVGVGLGSSTAAVLAGLVAADRLFRLALEEKTLFELGSIYETRAENLRAAWQGGFVACGEDAGVLSYRRNVVPENFALQVVVPEYAMANGAARSRAIRPDAPRNFRRAVALTEFFARPSGGPAREFESSLSSAVAKDVPGLEAALGVRLPGVLSVFVCGSGPGVGVLAQGDATGAVAAVREAFAQHGVKSTPAEFRPSNAGARDWNAVPPDITMPPLRGLGAAPRKSTSIPA